MLEDVIASTGFENFCGGQFWDINLTWNTDHPDFTPCFQQTVLVWVPCGFLWILLPFYSYYLLHLPYVNRACSKMNLTKLILNIVLLMVCMVDLIKGLKDYINNSESHPLVTVISPAIQMVTFILTVFLIRAEWRKGLITSGVLFLFFFLSVVFGIPILYSYIYRATQEGQVEDPFHMTTFLIYYSIIILQVIIYSFAESIPVQPARSSNKKPCPEIEASFLSRITFWWINGLVTLGYKTPLKENDMWEPPPRNLTRNNAPFLEMAWNKELRRCNWSQFSLPKDMDFVNGGTMHNSQDNTTDDDRDSETAPLLSSSRTKKDSVSEHCVRVQKPKGNPSLSLALARVFGPTLLVAHACKVVGDLLTFVGPMLQSQLIGYTEDPSVEVWKGYMYAVLFFVTSIVNSFFFNQLYYIGMTLGMRVKAAIVALVYKKALTMSNESRKSTTVGEIVNLMSVDAQRLQEAFAYLWMIWSAPLQIALAITLLWKLLGPSVLAGLGVMILLFPINAILASIQRKLQIAQMKQKDDRIKLMTEVLNGIKVLKLYAWELSFQEKVNIIRNKELTTLRKYAYLGAVGTFTWTCAPFLVTLATFTTYILTGGILDATKAFTALSLFNILRFPISMLPMMISYLVTASVSIKRLGKFLQNKDIDTDNVSHDPTTVHPLIIKNGTFAWGTDEDDLPVLKNISLTIPEGTLTAIVGQVGVGKSSLLSAIIGEMEKLEGRVNVKGTIAYVPQLAWIQNASLRDNILFGKPYDEARYNEVLDACALRPDLAILPGGDATEIGEKGINLSGGQKQRVSLARAVYQCCDIYLMDDPLSAVDSHVGKHIFEQVIGKSGLLKNKTRILVTHGIHWLPLVDSVVVLINGQISESGSYEQLLSHDGGFAQFLKTYFLQENNEDEETDSDPEIKKMKSQILQRVDSVIDEQNTQQSSTSIPTAERYSNADSQSAEFKVKQRRRQSSDTKSASDHSASKRQHSVKKDIPQDMPKNNEKLIQEEAVETGQVKLDVFLAYCKSLGYVLTVFVLIFFLLYQLASVMSSIWLSQWTEDSLLKNISLANTSDYVDKQYFYLGVYGGIGAAQAFFVLIYAVISALSNVRSSTILHSQMLTNILRSPIMFFDTTPVGRIINRFSRDIETIDNVLTQIIRSFLNTFFSVISTVVIISYSTPIFLSVVIPLFILYYFIQRFYIPTSRQLKRLEATSRSPIYVHFSETVTGASSIRAYGKQNDFMYQSENLVDHNLVYNFGNTTSNRWLGLRLEVLGGTVILAAALFAVIGRGNLSGGIVGLSLSYALQVTSALNWMVRMTTDLETNIVSVERIKEYSETPTEAEWHKGLVRPPHNWPGQGQMTFDHYATRYRPGLNLVLNDISVTIEAGEKIGIVGRTGAGKSSLTLAIFRLIEAAAGRIIIDNVVISDLGLYELRSKLTILPQDPVIFSGSLRMNLDPFQRHTDEELWQALESSYLKDFVKTLPTGLLYECGEGGQNLSLGQRQLICLARALLRKTKILILDEATAAVDLETDDLIQSTIQNEFSDCTVLTIAHRINTILGSDRVMVMDSGNIQELGNPSKLLSNKNSMFYSLAKNAGIVSS